MRRLVAVFTWMLESAGIHFVNLLPLAHLTWCAYSAYDAYTVAEKKGGGIFNSSLKLPDPGKKENNRSPVSFRRVGFESFSDEGSPAEDFSPIFSLRLGNDQ